jgi:hypothetical protein
LPSAENKLTAWAICREQINGVGDPVWFIADCGGQAQGPFPPSSIREMCKAGPLYVWREGMPEWTLSSELPDFAPVEKKSRKRASRPKRATAAELIDESKLTDEGISEITRSRIAVTIGLDRISVEASPGRTSRSTSAAKAVTRSYWTDELIGLCKGILADGEVNTKELVGLQNWLMACPCADIYPISAVAEIVEAIVADDRGAMKQKIAIRGKRGKKPLVRDSKWERRAAIEQRALRPVIRMGQPLDDPRDDERPGRDW